MLSSCLRLSRWLNDRLDTASYYRRDDLLGTCLRQVCLPPTCYRAKSADTGLLEARSLPARLNLRPLASHAVLTYFFLFLLLTALFGSRFAFRLAFVFVTVWMVRLLVQHFRRRRDSHSRQHNSGLLRKMDELEETFEEGSPILRR